MRTILRESFIGPDKRFSFSFDTRDAQSIDVSHFKTSGVLPVRKPPVNGSLDSRPEKN